MLEQNRNSLNLLKVNILNNVTYFIFNLDIVIALICNCASAVLALVLFHEMYSRGAQRSTVQFTHQVPSTSFTSTTSSASTHLHR